jgi:hypothetical protein
MSFHSGSSVALLVAIAQLDATAAVLKEATTRIEAAKIAAAHAAEQETARAQQSEQVSERAPEQDNPNRIVPLAEASRLSSLSKDTILRNHRDKLIQLSERRLGMRVRDALMLANKES